MVTPVVAMQSRSRDLRRSDDEWMMSAASGAKASQRQPDDREGIVVANFDVSQRYRRFLAHVHITVVQVLCATQ